MSGLRSWTGREFHKRGPEHQKSQSATFMLLEKGVHYDVVCPFSCRLNSPYMKSGLHSWTGREFHKRRPEQRTTCNTMPLTDILKYT